MTPFLTINDARAQLPKVGDVRWEVPTIDENSGHVAALKPLQKCVVVDVRPEKLWYTVRFENGIKESYKVPRLTDRGGAADE